MGSIHHLFSGTMLVTVSQSAPSDDGEDVRLARHAYSNSVVEETRQRGQLSTKCRQLSKN